MNRFLKRQPDATRKSRVQTPTANDRERRSLQDVNPVASFDIIRRDQILLASFIVASIAFLVIVSVFVFTGMSLPPDIPLLYSKPWGEGQLVPLTAFILLPLTILVIVVANLLVGRWLYPPYPTLTRLLFLFTALYSLLLAFTIVKIVFLVR